MRTTQKQFFDALKARANSRGYGFDIRTADASWWKNGFLREKRTGCCPVVAVARHLGKRVAGKVSYDLAATAIGLDTKFAERVVAAADSMDDTPLRRKLLRACGLPVPQSVAY